MGVRVNPISGGGSTVLSLVVGADTQSGSFVEWSSYVGDLDLPVGTYTYNGTLIIKATDWQNWTFQCEVANTGGGSIAVDGYYQLTGYNSTSGASAVDLHYAHVNNGSMLVDINTGVGIYPDLYAKIELSGTVVVSTATATIEARVGNSGSTSNAAILYKGSKIDFIQQ